MRSRVKRLVSRAERAGQDSAIPWYVAAALVTAGRLRRGKRRGGRRQCNGRVRTLGMEVSGWRETNGTPKKLDSLGVLNVVAAVHCRAAKPNQTKQTVVPLPPALSAKAWLSARPGNRNQTSAGIAVAVHILRHLAFASPYLIKPEPCDFDVEMRLLAANAHHIASPFVPRKLVSPKTDTGRDFSVRASQNISNPFAYHTQHRHNVQRPRRPSTINACQCAVPEVPQTRYVTAILSLLRLHTDTLRTSLLV